MSFSHCRWEVSIWGCLSHTPISKTWKQRARAACRPVWSASRRRGWKARSSSSTACRSRKFSRWPRNNRSISLSWGRTAVPDSTTCSWAAWQKKSCAWRHVQCWSCVSRPWCRYRKGGSLMAFTHVLIPTDFSAPAQQAVRYALEEATLHHAKVTLLHILPAQHTGTDIYFVTGAPGPQPGFEPALERRLGTPTPTQLTVVLDDHYEAALTQLRDLMPAA